MTTTKKIILKKLKELQTIWHPESGLVFKSREEKIVTGMYIDNEFIQLDDDAISLCETWGFKFDNTLLVSEDEQHDDESDDQQDDESDDNEIDNNDDQPDDESNNNEDQPDDDDESNNNEDQPDDDDESNNNEDQPDDSEINNDESPNEQSETEKCQPDLLRDINLLKNGLEQYIDDNKNTVSRLTGEIDNAKDAYNTLLSERNILASELDKLQIKFKTLKGLFE